MGGVTSTNDDVNNNDGVVLHVLNCDHREYYVKLVDTGVWKKIGVKKTLQSIKVWPNCQVELYKKKNQTKLLKSFTMSDYNQSMLLYIKNNRKLKVMEYPVESKYQRPFYLIAHRVNNPAGITSVVADGVNAIEIDAFFSTEDQNWYVNHDAPEGTLIEDWFREASSFMLPMVIVDTKTPCPKWRLEDLLKRIRKTKYRWPIIIAVATEVDCLVSLEKKLNTNEGMATDFLEVTPELVGELPLDCNVWYGNGVHSRMTKVMLKDSIEKAIFLRNNGTKIKKVYAWSFDTSSSFLEYLSADIDGLMVEPDFVQEANALVESYPFVRKATLKDHPFQQSNLGCGQLTTRKKKKKKT